MKTNELIAALQKADPDNEAEVVVGGCPIYFVEKLPGYYDGSYAILLQDHSKDPYYNITGIKHTRSGYKVRLNIMETDDILYDNPDAIVEYDKSMGDSASIARLQEGVEKTREEVRKLEAEIAQRRESQSGK